MREDPLWKLLGDLPEDRPASAKLVRREAFDGYRLESLLLELNGIEEVPAYVALPEEGEGPYPVVLFNHSHGGNYEQGKRELIRSSPYLQQDSFARELTAMGYAACCIDMWCFGERGGRAESETFKEMLWNGQVMWGMMLHDNLKFLDYLCGREDTDSSRIATVGMSMGAMMAWWSAALDERIGVTVDICGQVEARALIERRGLDHHGFYSYVPGLLKHAETIDIQKRIVPRPRISLNGGHDRLCPPEGVRRLDGELRAAYAEAGCPERWSSVVTGGGHAETLEMRECWKGFLREHL
ncbi:dienelactone hydrolase family protein [Saccharibacillus alkalitolerans]|uniref:Alpha/beta hydrolase n=1 Tax=Saccharibacillus alkalitolerans TaxID=2705290 RepID=A0ABX0F2Y8_9BACL|nr:dienelactone hydrolase family protein [Saccharibacillus alkalitolerans]NGZ74314.1 alpha/beta hydrolase [Saccharibacillus alkalitolerans]